MNNTASHSIEAARIGLVAGWGCLPHLVAMALTRQGYRVYCLGIKDHADPGLRDVCHDYKEIGGTKLGAAIRYFRRHGVTRATMAGKIHKLLLFQRFGWIRHMPDWRCFRTFYPHFVGMTKDRADDTLLHAIIDAYAEDGITFAPATEFAPELLVKPRTLSRRRLSNAEKIDVEYGWKIAKEIGRVDVGQSVVVKGRAVLAVEAIEGTDECIRRAGALCSQGGFIVVKVAKPQQDMRFDVPTIGLETLETLVQAGGRVLAIEAEKTIVLQQPQVVDFANRHRLTLVAVTADQAGSLIDAA